jgi:hypothetical protein
MNSSYDYQRVGEYALAVADLDELVRRFPKSADAFRDRGVAYLLWGHLGEAQRDISRAVEFKSSQRIGRVFYGVLTAQGPALPNSLVSPIFRTRAKDFSTTFIHSVFIQFAILCAERVDFIECLQSAGGESDLPQWSVSC